MKSKCKKCGSDKAEHTFKVKDLGRPRKLIQCEASGCPMCNIPVGRHKEITKQATQNDN